MGEVVTVEVAYARRDRQSVLSVEVPPGATAEQAIRQSGILDRYPEIDLARHRVGIFGKPCGLDRELKNGDRVEIYRPLTGDPKEIRRKLAAQGKVMGKPGQ